MGFFGNATFRQGVLSGESCIREVAAYIIDRKRFSGVPSTTFVEVVHASLKYEPFSSLGQNNANFLEIMSSLIKPVDNEIDDDSPADLILKNPSSSTNPSSNLSKEEGTLPKKSVAMQLATQKKIGMKFGSLQEFCKSEGPIENFSSDKFHKDEIHKIGILDLRILNIDRNETNILVRTKVNKTGKRVWSLIPIDHGLTFPDNLAVCSFDLAWMSWRQAEAPFSSRTMKFIESINVDEDIELLEKTFKFRTICLRNAKITTLLLIKGAKAGLTLSSIG